MNKSVQLTVVLLELEAQTVTYLVVHAVGIFTVKVPAFTTHFSLQD